jgi:hypothetical protein
VAPTGGRSGVVAHQLKRLTRSEKGRGLMDVQLKTLGEEMQGGRTVPRVKPQPPGMGQRFWVAMGRRRHGLRSARS